jgi:CBS domain-containing protein
MVTDVVTIDGIATIREALHVMREKRIKSLVVNRRSKDDAYGIVTFYDIIEKVVTRRRQLDMTNVCDIMTKPLLTVSQGLRIKYAAGLMSQFDVKRAVIIKEGELVALISMEDIVYSLLDDEDD